jgi:putative CocE/NonD family hydrolase
MRACLAYVIVFLFSGVFAVPGLEAQGGRRVSEFGTYEGYSTPRYYEWSRSSRYVAMRDGVRLAVDIIRPAAAGQPVEAPLPAVWSHRRYRRAREVDGRVVSVVERDPTLETLLRHGYVIVAVDARGTGASYGHRTGPYSQEETRDAYEITEWLASQPWCDGNVGMFGQSYMGVTQLLAAGQAPPHLKAVFPSVFPLDLYNTMFPGGVYREPLITGLFRALKRVDLEAPALPVDEDTPGALLAEALSEHRENRYADPTAGPFRDSQHGFDWVRHNPVTHLGRVSQSNVPAYVWTSWYDVFTLDAFQWYVNLRPPTKLAAGVWAHQAAVLNAEERRRLRATEQLRWFDYWLKGIENGVLDEPPIHYATKIDEVNRVWRSAGAWPPAETKLVRYYFRRGRSGTVASVNDGALTTQAPVSDAGQDTYLVDYSTSSGRTTRWHLSEFAYPDMSGNDAKSLTYTSEPLKTDLTVTGHPVVTLHVSSTAADGDFFVYLEEVDAAGVSEYITEGVLRASHRAVSEPPFENMGLPYHRSFRDDVKPLPDADPVSLLFDLLPTSNRFDAGSRIRVSVACADADNAEVQEVAPPPEVTLHRSRLFPSGIALPVVPE